MGREMWRACSFYFVGRMVIEFADTTGEASRVRHRELVGTDLEVETAIKKLRVGVLNLHSRVVVEMFVRIKGRDTEVMFLISRDEYLTT